MILEVQLIATQCAVIQSAANAVHLIAIHSVAIRSAGITNHASYCYLNAAIQSVAIAMQLGGVCCIVVMVKYLLTCFS